MPIATGLGDDRKRFDLQSLPEGYVVIRRMTYGEKMMRKSFLSKAKINSDGGGSRADRRSKSASAFSAELDLMNEQVTQFEFANCILDHNLTYLSNPNDPSTETKLDFRIPGHVKMLDGRVGEEIDELIEDYNSFEVDEEVGKSPTPSTT
jgi:hypothetical protein